MAEDRASKVPTKKGKRERENELGKEKMVYFQEQEKKSYRIKWFEKNNWFTEKWG